MAYRANGRPAFGGAGLAEQDGGSAAQAGGDGAGSGTQSDGSGHRLAAEEPGGCDRAARGYRSALPDSEISAAGSDSGEWWNRGIGRNGGNGRHRRSAGESARAA